MTRRRRGGVKMEESNLASNQFLICSPQSGTPREVHELHREEKREEGDGVTRRSKEGVKRGETNLASNQLPKCSPQPRTPREIHREEQRREGEGGR